jgi:DNA-binding MarR family transcriptional regulator
MIPLGQEAGRVSTADRRTREAILNRKGKAATDAVDVAREEIAPTLFEDWSHRDFDELVRLMRMLADRLNETPGGQVE